MPRSSGSDRRRLDDGEDVTLVGRVSKALRDDIVSGLYPAGARLNMDAIAHRIGVSIIPVREALRGLATEGLVTLEVNKGYRVRSASLADLEETYSLRALLDPLAVSLAVPLMAEEELDELGEQVEAMRLAEERHDAAAYWQHHGEFHFGLYRNCGQSWLLRFVSALYANSDRYRPAASGPPSPRHLEHLEVLNACRARDGAEAARLMREHLEHTYVMWVPTLPNPPTDLTVDHWPQLDWDRVAAPAKAAGQRRSAANGSG